MNKSFRIEEIEKEPRFIKLNPNGRITVLIDRSRGDFIVFETVATLLYLVEHYDKEQKTQRYGGVGSMQAQCERGESIREKSIFARDKASIWCSRNSPEGQRLPRRGWERYLQHSRYQRPSLVSVL